MILQRLYELAQRENLLDDPAFLSTQVSCMVTIGKAGEFLGLMDVRKREEIHSKKKGAAPKVRFVGDRAVPVPVRPVVWDEARKKWKSTDPAASGKEKPAVFLADTIARVLPVERLIENKDRAKCQTQRSTFWRFLRYAAEQTKDEALLAFVAFSDRLESPEMQERLAAEVEGHKLPLSDLCVLAWEPDRGLAVPEREGVRSWWRRFYKADCEIQQEGQYRGLCQVTRDTTAIGTSIKSKIYGLIPIGCRAEAYLVTGLQSAESYNLPGAAAGMVSAAGIDGFTRGLNALIGNEFKRGRTSVRVGKVLFLFWTRRNNDGGMSTVFDPTEEFVEKLFASPYAGKEFFGLSDEDVDVFYLLSLSGNSARVVVRDYLEVPLPRLLNNLKEWFLDLTIADARLEGVGQPTSLFPLRQLAGATIPEDKRQRIPDWEKLNPDVPIRLLHSALKRDPIPDSVLAACLGRLRVEGGDGFRPARLALIKLTLLRRDVPVTATLNEEETHPAYICGRLLSVFEQIQYAALGDVNSSVTDKYFGTFSVAPAMVLGRLFANSQNHLRRLRGEKPGQAVVLDKLLAETSKKLAAPPDRQLSLRDQGRFALGYYHQKAKRFEEIAERKAAKAEAKSDKSDIQNS